MDGRGILMRSNEMVTRWVQAFCRNRKGVAAIEFAFIAPLLFVLYFVTMEVSQGIETNKKVSRVGSMVSDLVGQQGREVYTADLDAIMEIGEAVLKPYTRSPVAITITGIEIDKNMEAKVKWSRKMVNGNFTRDDPKGTITTVAKELQIPETFLLRVEAKLDYLPMIAWTAEQKMALGLFDLIGNIQMAEAYNLRPRMTTEMNCSNC